MERTQEILEARVRNTPLEERLKDCQKRIGNMCAELRGPKMSIPVEHYDDDFYINTTLADAQAQIAALQARVRELEEWKRIVTGAGTDQESVIRLAAYEYTKIAVQCWKEANAKLEAQLTQRTAECDALKLVNDTHMKTVMKLSHVVEQRTAELEAANNYLISCPWCFKKMEHNAVLSMSHLIECGDKRQAELERVRAQVQQLEKDNATLHQFWMNADDWLAYNDKQAAIQRERDTLRTLIAALPKVDGEIVAQAGYVKDRKKVYACFGSVADMTAYAALLQHRQGME